MIKKKDFITFAVLMVEFAFIEIFGAVALWSRGWFFLGYMGWLIVAIVGLYRYITTLNEVCAGEGKDSLNGILVCLLGWITFSIYYIYWIYNQEKRMCKKGEQFGLNLWGNENKTAICMLGFQIIFYYSSHVASQHENVYGGVDVDYVMLDNWFLFLQALAVAMLILVAWRMTQDLNYLIYENNRSEWMAKDYVVQSQDVDEVWFCTQCGQKNGGAALFCPSCGKQKI